MLTIDRLHKVDRLALRIIAALDRGIEWVGDHHEALLVNAAYKVAEAKATAIGKAEDKISDLEDKRMDLVAEGAEAKIVLAAKYKAALAALDKDIAQRGDKIGADLAAAAQALVAATKDYEQTIAEATDKLGVGVEA